MNIMNQMSNSDENNLVPVDENVEDEPLYEDFLLTNAQ